MIKTLRSRILFISTATVVAALVITGIAAYSIARSGTLQTLEQDLDAITAGNAMAIDQWVAAKVQAVTATAAAIEYGDPHDLSTYLAKAGGFPITSVGWADKSFKSTVKVAAGYDPTSRPWYKTAAQAGKLVVTKPYPDSVSGIIYVAFTMPMLRNGSLEGVLSGAVSLDGVREVVSAIRPTPNSSGFVVNTDGLIVAHPDARYVLKPATELSERLTPAALTQLVRTQSPMAATLDGRPHLLQAKPVNGTDWLLVVAMDEAEATAGLGSLLRTLILAVVVLVLLAAAISAALTTKSFRRLSQVRDAMDKIGSGGGDLTQRLPVSGQDEVAQISSSFNRFVEQIATVLQDVRSGVESMRTATDEIKAGNVDLSHRTESTASSLEETSAALSELTANARQSAESSDQASRLAQAASASAARGGEAVESAVATMDEISRTSSKIGEIISVIDGIAFQTNILALNAAVEAARAGEQGKGFAVVAGEVRALAQRSAQAAREIKTLIDASSTSVQAGTERVRTAGVIMGEIVQDIQHVTQIIGEINGAMTEQSSGIGQINQAVADMDRAVQENAALVEESTAASVTLNEQAHYLADTVSAFTLESGSEHVQEATRNRTEPLLLSSR